MKFNKKVAIIGGAGFIGFNLAIHLKNLGCKVFCIDSLQVNNLMTVVSNIDKLPYPKLSEKIINQRLELLKKNDVPLVIEDARDYNLLSSTLAEIEPEIIIHLAAVSHANRSNKTPHSTFDHSLRTLENALDYAKNNVDHFIFNSSSMIYGNFESDSVNEESACNPIGIYGALKFSAEKILESYNQVFDLPYTIIRPSALYGRGCISRRVSQIFIENAIMKQDILVNGDGNEKLDFTSIDDLLFGYEKIIERPNAKNEIFNISGGFEQKNIDTVKKVIDCYFEEKVEDYDQYLDFSHKREGQDVRYSLDDSKLKKLGWCPKKIFHEEIDEIVKYYKNNFKW